MIKPPTEDTIMDKHLTKSDVGATKKDNKPLATDSAEIKSRQDAKPYNSNYSLRDGFADAIFSGILGELLLIIPFGTVAWIFITWGVMWLFIPLIIIMLIVIKVIHSRYTHKP